MKRTGSLLALLLSLVLIIGLLPAPTLAADVALSPQKLTVDGRSVDCEKYNIGGRNYFKLRDLAYLLNGTGSQFGVGYDEATSTVSIATGAPYTPNGTELAAGKDNSATARSSSQTILINGVKRSDLTVYNIGGSNFFQLRELGTALGFEVDYDAATDTAIVLSGLEELQRAKAAGLLPEEWQNDMGSVVTVAEFNSLLSKVVAMFNNELLPEWESLAAQALQCADKAQRDDAVLSVLEAAVLMGVENNRGGGSVTDGDWESKGLARDGIHLQLAMNFGL